MGNFSRLFMKPKIHEEVLTPNTIILGGESLGA